MPQTRVMIKGVEPFESSGLLSDQVRRHITEGGGKNLQVEAFHEGWRGPEIEPAVAGDVHCRELITSICTRLSALNIGAFPVCDAQEHWSESSLSATSCAPSPKTGPDWLTCMFAI